MSSSDLPGELFIIAAPSGAGKTSLIASLLKRHPDIALSVSDTTRKPRQGEVEGEHYHFLDRAAFVQGIEQGKYLEHAEVFGNFYGTRREHVESRRVQGRQVLLEIDIQGAAQVRKAVPDACGIFILPPSLGALEGRLHGRGLDEPAVIRRRLEEARNEMQAWKDFDFVVVNDDFDQACDELSAIVTAWCLRIARQKKAQQGLIEQLLGGDESSSSSLS